MQVGQTLSCNLQSTISSTWKTKNIKAIVLLIRDSDSSILNSKTVLLSKLGVESIAEKGAEPQVYPNPSNTAATLRFSLSTATSLGISVTDITGRTFYQYPDGLLPVGTHTLSFGTANWAPGIYFVTLRTKDCQETIKLSVLH
jgi:hypothetical protein